MVVVVVGGKGVVSRNKHQLNWRSHSSIVRNRTHTDDRVFAMIHVERILMIEWLLYDPRRTHTDDRVFAMIHVECILMI